MERQNFCQKLYGIKQKAFRVTLVVYLLLLTPYIHSSGRHSRLWKQPLFPEQFYTCRLFSHCANCEKFSLMHFPEICHTYVSQENALNTNQKAHYYYPCFNKKKATKSLTFFKDLSERSELFDLELLLLLPHKKMPEIGTLKT